MSIEELKEKVFEAELNLSRGTLRWQFARLEFDKAPSAKTFNAMDDERLACAGLMHEKESSIALLEETLAEMAAIA